jgi:tetratricopeptide (TPR) repeat protein
LSAVPLLKLIAQLLLVSALFFGSLPSSATANALAEATRLLHSGKYEEAAHSYGALLAAEPQSAAALAGRVRALLKQDKVAEALEAAKVAVATLPENPMLHTVLGEIYFRKGWIPEADEEFRKAIKLDAKVARAWLGLGRVAMLMSKHKTAKEYFERAQDLDSEDPDVVEHWAGTLKSVEKEVEALEKYLKLAPYRDAEDLEATRSHIEIHKQLGDRKLFVLASEYASSEIPLEWLVYDVKRAKGFGIKVSVNGGKPKTLLLDTGASGIMLGRKHAEKLGVKRLTGTKLHGVGDRGPATGYTGFVERVRIGNVEFRDCVVRVSDKNSIGDEAGILGTDVFKKFLVTVDLAKRRLRLDSLPARRDGGGEDDPYDRAIYPEMKHFTPVYVYGHHLLITTKVGDAPPALFNIDTGASTNFISVDLAKSVAKVHDDRRFQVKGISGLVKDVYSADRLVWQFARFRQENRNVLSFDFSKLNKKLELELSGALGMPLLAVFQKFVINYRDGLVDFDYKP